MKSLTAFYKEKKVFITGHTGFKGSWLSAILLHMGATLYGYSHKEYPLFELADLKNKMASSIEDIRDYESLKSAIDAFKPDILFHLAAQPLVIDSYNDPRYTYETNIMGTVNVLEAVRFSDSVKTVINVTTDKVYKNNEWDWGYRESDALNGYDPYSNSKSCSELVTSAYKNCFLFPERNIAISTARAGNVIGGGDFSENRIIPDCIRAAKDGRAIIVRNRHSIRPWQHVMEPLSGYITLARSLALGETSEGSFNFGPDDADCVDVGTLTDLFCSAWGQGAMWEDQPQQNAVHEAAFLKLDCSMAKKILKWHPRWNVKQAVEKTVKWQKALDAGVSAYDIMTRQIGDYWG